MKLKALVPSVLLGFALSGAVFAHVGTQVFMPQVPNPAAMTIDGKDDDWGWYDQSFAVTPDQMISWLGEGEGATPPAADYSVSYFTAWSPPPDNRFYFFARVEDDTLRAAEGEVRGRWWNDDMVQISIDADHSAGNYLAKTLEELENGQRYEMVPTQPPPCNIGGSAEFEAREDWAGGEPWALIATTILPPDATNLSANVTYTFEFSLALWDRFSIDGPDASARHIFAPEQAIGASIRFDDGDRGEIGEQALYGIRGGSYLGDRDGSQAGDYIPLATAPITAVEDMTWGRIKSYVNQKLQR